MKNLNQIKHKENATLQIYGTTIDSPLPILANLFT